MKNKIYNYSGGIKKTLVLLAVILIIWLLLYTKSLVDSLRKETEGFLKFYAEVYAKAATDYNMEDFSFIFDQIIKRISVPMIISQEKSSKPTAWRNIGLEKEQPSEIDTSKVEEIMREMDRVNDPIPLKYNGYILGYIHYGDTDLIKRLRIFPYVEITIVGLFIFLGYLGFHFIRSSEKRSIWVGMAKETAHQLGTPLTSLMGWVEVLEKENIPDEVRGEIKRDLERLKKVANRFSQIGSKPVFEECDLKELIEEVIDYFKKRLPQLGKEISLDFKAKGAFKAMINADLFTWSLENVVKNAIDSVSGVKEGKVRIELKKGKADREVVVDVIDNGKGILKRNFKNVFRPGYSTKKRGWGLGLSLVRRIIEDYHKGKVFVKESVPGERTVIRFVLKGRGSK
ncbi:MAG: sensor histidine kinase [Candidatus Neomarinimicrobiota bacterium]|nr:MAG: sensor histidine kinase [Candidatus Neomarinimicrobiota bacterium]HDN59218.1 HAMP domain-containing histidine kinase [Candidatus Neomarinimicrobiota bacterium]